MEKWAQLRGGMSAELCGNEREAVGQCSQGRGVMVAASVLVLELSKGPTLPLYVGK